MRPATATANGLHRGDRRARGESLVNSQDHRPAKEASPQERLGGQRGQGQRTEAQRHGGPARGGQAEGQGNCQNGRRPPTAWIRRSGFGEVEPAAPQSPQSELCPLWRFKIAYVRGRTPAPIPMKRPTRRVRRPAALRSAPPNSLPQPEKNRSAICFCPDLLYTVHRFEPAPALSWGFPGHEGV